jgi:DNA-binding response OmpR family regulator
MDTKTERRILLVEDHLDTATMMRLVLERNGYSVITAASCAEAHVKSDGQHIDMIVCDIGLPDGSGVDLLGQLRKLHHAPAIAVSGFGTRDDVTRSLAAGFAEHVTKPLGMHELLRAVERALSTTASETVRH